MSSPWTDEHPGALFRQVISTTLDLDALLARQVGLGVTDFRALDHLLSRGPLGPHDLGRLLGLTSPAATALADRLERAGHVTRERDPEDRRRVALVPTEHAREEAWRVLREYVAEFGELVDDLSPEERAAASRFLGRVLDLQRRHVTRLLDA